MPTRRSGDRQIKSILLQIMPRSTPLGSSWLTMAASIRRLRKRRRRDGQHPQRPAAIGAWFRQTAQAWNRQPTPFLWNGQRRQRRRRQPDHGQARSGSAAHTQQPVPPHNHRLHDWHSPRQVTH
jgi:hypothetical protein